MIEFAPVCLSCRYGHVRLAVRLQLVHGGTGMPAPRAFFNTWATLPVRAELAGEALWGERKEGYGCCGQSQLAREKIGGEGGGQC